MCKRSHADVRPVAPYLGATASHSIHIMTGLFFLIFLLADTTGATPFSAPKRSSSLPSPTISPTTSAIPSLGQTTSLARPNKPIQAPLARRTPQIDNGASSSSSSSTTPTSTGSSSSIAATSTRPSTTSNSCLRKTCYTRSSLTTCYTNIEFHCLTSTTSSYRYSYTNYGSNYGSGSSSSTSSGSTSGSSTILLAIVLPFVAIFVIVVLSRCAARSGNTTGGPSSPPAASTTANTATTSTAPIEMSAISRSDPAREPVHREEEEEGQDRAEGGDRLPPYGEQEVDGGSVVAELAAVSAPTETHTRGTSPIIYHEAGHGESGGTGGGGGQSQWVDPAPAYVGQ